MNHELASELQRLWIVEARLRRLSVEASEMTDTFLADTKAGMSTEALKVMMNELQREIRGAIEDWQKTNLRIQALAPAAQS